MSAEMHEKWMRRALELAQLAQEQDEVPVGAVVVLNGEIIGEGYNQPLTAHDPSAHAEIVAIRAAAQHQQNYRLPESTLYVTIEPCTMCVGAMIHARIKDVVFGAREPRAGALLSQLELQNCDFYNHSINVTEAILAEECSELIKSFFKAKR